MLYFPKDIVFHPLNVDFVSHSAESDETMHSELPKPAFEFKSNGCFSFKSNCTRLSNVMTMLASTRENLS